MIFEALGGTHENGLFLNQRADALVHGAREVGGHDTEDDLCAFQRFFERGIYYYIYRKFVCRQIDVVDPGFSHARGEIGFIDPEFYCRKPGSENDGERSAPT